MAHPSWGRIRMAGFPFLLLRCMHPPTLIHLLSLIHHKCSHHLYMDLLHHPHPIHLNTHTCLHRTLAIRLTLLRLRSSIHLLRLLTLRLFTLLQTTQWLQVGRLIIIIIVNRTFPLVEMGVLHLFCRVIITLAGARIMALLRTNVVLLPRVPLGVMDLVLACTIIQWVPPCTFLRGATMVVVKLLVQD